MNKGTALPSKTIPGAYQSFCQALKITPIFNAINLHQYSDITTLANQSTNARLTAALRVFIECIAHHNTPIKRVDPLLIDQLILAIDQILSHHLDNILHHPEFQALESIWRGLEYLIQHTDFRSNIKIELLNISQEALCEDFERTPDITQSGLYQHLYAREYDTPGGEPFAAMISNYEFASHIQDISLLNNIAKVAALTHCPFIGSVGGAFFGKSNFEEVSRIYDLPQYMERAEFIRWNTFREKEEARYIGLTCPRFLIRLPYTHNNFIQYLKYEEQVHENTEKYLWCSASFAFAANMTKSFQHHGWTVNIRGPESGGKVEALPLHQYDIGRGLFTKTPTEAIIPETRELELAHLGFIPLSYYKNSDYACFFSANSVQKPKVYLPQNATANSRINARLPYIFLSARIAHYLKVLQRETIGSQITRATLEDRLNAWLQTLITKMNHPDPEQIAAHPLREGHVEVSEHEDNPGFYHVILYAMPHFQIEGIDVNLSIVSKMPKSEQHKRLH